MSLKQKTVKGLKWSFIDNTANTGVQFIFGIILARILDPKEWGLIGMLTIFISVSQALIDSGFSNALIRKRKCTETDYSTVFYFSLAAGVIFYLILFFSADPISRFYKEPQLFLLVRVIGLGLVINALTIIHRTILTRELNFKLQAVISVIASVFSGIISIVLAFNGFGVWSLAFKTIAQGLIILVLFWTLNRWRPIFVFSIASFRELFNYGYKLLISALIYTANTNLFYLVIGRYFSATELGYYNRADQFKNLPSSNITGIIQRVSFPVLSSVQNDAVKLKAGYQKLIKSTMFITFILMIGMASVAKPMVIVLIGEKWLLSVPYLQLLCFSGMLFPLHALNLNMLQVKGRSDLFLKMEIIKVLLLIPVIPVGIFFGIKIMISGMIVTSLVAYFINSYYSGDLIDYNFREQVMDILPSFLIATMMGLIVYSLGFFLQLKPILNLAIQLLTGTGIILISAEVFKPDAYIEVKEIISEARNKKMNTVIQNGKNSRRS
jgi:O-antigen/teichoic acid export membrane protein